MKFVVNCNEKQAKEIILDHPHKWVVIKERVGNIISFRLSVLWGGYLLKGKHTILLVPNQSHTKTRIIMNYAHNTNGFFTLFFSIRDRRHELEFWLRDIFKDLIELEEF